MKLQRLLIACTGNICRSPIAEGLIKVRAPGLECASAGTHALVGRAAEAYAQEIMAEHGFDISAHRAQQATEKLLNWADLILVSEQAHADWIVRRAAHLRGRVHKLGKWRDNADIADPYRAPRRAFEDAYADISGCVDDWLSRL